MKQSQKAGQRIGLTSAYSVRSLEIRCPQHRSLRRAGGGNNYFSGYTRIWQNFSENVATLLEHMDREHKVLTEWLSISRGPITPVTCSSKNARSECSLGLPAAHWAEVSLPAGVRETGSLQACSKEKEHNYQILAIEWTYPQNVTI